MGLVQGPRGSRKRVHVVTTSASSEAHSSPKTETSAVTLMRLTIAALAPISAHPRRTQQVHVLPCGVGLQGTTG